MNRSTEKSCNECRLSQIVAHGQECVRTVGRASACDQRIALRSLALATIIALLMGTFSRSRSCKLGRRPGIDEPHEANWRNCRFTNRRNHYFRYTESSCINLSPAQLTLLTNFPVW
ncbi:uncharacterized protein LOC143358843 [Halictus rubicundus]|uniref:uncharacterized protein LOC143358843 n=1 Tax=Halictus rubicundus TaxID=77578 RepID=UPI004036BD3C